MLRTRCCDPDVSLRLHSQLASILRRCLSLLIFSGRGRYAGLNRLALAISGLPRKDKASKCSPRETMIRKSVLETLCLDSVEQPVTEKE